MWKLKNAPQGGKLVTAHWTWAQTDCTVWASEGKAYTGWRRLELRQGAGRNKRAEGKRRGGNSLSAKQCWAGMYSRLFAHVTWLATDQRAVWHRWRGPERCGGGGMDVLRQGERWVEDKMSCTNQRSFFMFSQLWFMCDCVDVGSDCSEMHIYTYIHTCRYIERERFFFFVKLEEIFQKVPIVFQNVCHVGEDAILW